MVTTSEGRALSRPNWVIGRHGGRPSKNCIAQKIVRSLSLIFPSKRIPVTFIDRKSELAPVDELALAALPKVFLRYSEIGFTIDISRMRFADNFLQSMGARAQRAFSEMRQLEAGAIANPDERRMVGHYWLRNPGLAPSASLRNDIEETNARIKKFAAAIHAGEIAPATGKFRHLLVIGIGGSALGPQFVADALGNTGDPMAAFFFDNTDPDGFDRVWGKLERTPSRKRW